MARRAWKIAATVVLVAAGLLAAQRAAAQSVAAQDRTWDVSVKLAEKTMERQPGWDFVPIDDPANCLLLLEVAVVYVGPAGPVPAPRVAVEDEQGRRHDAWGNTMCSMADKPCFEAMDWVLSATHETPDTRVLATGDTISTGSLTYYFEVPRSASAFILHYGANEPTALEVANRLPLEDAAAPSAAVSTAAVEARQKADGLALLREAQAAVGGAEALARIDDFVRVAHAGGLGQAPWEQRTVRWMKAGPVRWDDLVRRDRHPSSMLLEDGSGWRQGPRDGQPSVAGEQERMSLRGRADSELLSCLRCDTDPDCTVVSYWGRTLSLIRPEVTVSMELDESGLPTARRVTIGNRVVEEVLADWRPVDGILLPFKVTRSAFGSAFEEETTTEWRLNVGLTAVELRKLR